jgi:purine-binding chemotaxis protein CheW
MEPVDMVMRRSTALPEAPSSVENGHPDLLNRADLAVLTFMVEGQIYGLAVVEVVQIIEMVTITHLPHIPAAIRGIINVRGQIVPVLDLRLRLGCPPRPYRLHTPIILADYRDRILGLIVDQVGEVVTLATADLKPAATILPPEIVNQAGSDHGLAYLTGVGQLARTMIPILNLTAILSPGEERQLLTALAEQLSDGGSA